MTLAWSTAAADAGWRRRARQRPAVAYVDTSAIIDGRLVDVVASGFLSARWWCRASCSASSSTSPTTPTRPPHRGRRGLEMLAVLQKDHRVDLELTDEDAPDVKAVDAKLVALARARGGAVLTTDYNLNRVAQLQGVRVMNLNQLANAMKPAFLPGEEMRVKVIQQGKEPGQGVAFLDDGTMIVVEGGGSLPAARARRDGDPGAPDGGRPDGLRPAASGRQQPQAAPARAGPRVGARDAPRQGTIGACATLRSPSPTRSSWPPAPSRAWAAPTSSRADLGGRPLLRWAVEAMRGARQVAAVDRRRPPPSAWPSSREPTGCAPSTSRVARGWRSDGRTRWPPACAPRPRRSCSSTTGRGRSPRPGPRRRGGRAARAHGAAIPVAARRRLAQARRRRARRLAPSTRAGLSRAQTPQGARRELLAARPSTPSPTAPRSSATRRSCWRATACR